MRIEVKNISKSFKDNEVIKDISISFTENKIYGIFGRNGTGKSVFLKLICGFYIPDSGEIKIDGINYNLCNDFPKDLRALIEKPSFFPELTGYENLKLLADIQRKIDDKQIREALDIVNLTEDMDKKYHKYSLGMKQKLGIAQVIMENPKIMILDEPFNGIEEETVKKLIMYFKRIKKDKIIIICSHIKEDLYDISDKIYKFSAGQITCEKE
ncbi:MAG: ATP-binding cassette domain-containing protein [Mycoplasmatota bacterium]|nr:ATP-binding cassette domain-containing protein [Mycoplasmatota bacterium]